MAAIVSIPRLFVVPIRILGIVSAILFIVIVARIFLGEPLLPTAMPLPKLCLSVTCSDVYRLDMDALARDINNWLLR